MRLNPIDIKQDIKNNFYIYKKKEKKHGNGNSIIFRRFDCTTLLSICRKDIVESNVVDIYEEMGIMSMETDRMLGSLLQGKREYGGRKVKAEAVHLIWIHSIKLPNKGHDPEHQRAEEKEFETYERELIEEIEYLNKLNVRNIIFSNTTPSPKNHRVRNDLDVVRLNEIAKKVMKEKGIPYNDVYSFVKAQENYPRLYLHPKAENNCHFNDIGREVLGNQIGKFILDNMKFLDSDD